MEAPRHSLSFWLRLSYAAVVVVTSAALGLLVDRQPADALEAVVRARMQADARVLANGFDRSLEERQGDMRLLSLLPGLRSGSPDPSGIYPFFQRLAENEPEYAWIGFADASG